MAGNGSRGTAEDAAAKKTKQLGEILIDEGLIEPEKLEMALVEQGRTERRLGRILIDMGLVKEQDLVAALAKQIGFGFVDLTDFQIDPTATALVPETVARRYRALPIGYDEDGKLLVAMADPANLFALDDIRTMTGMEIKPMVATAADIDAAIRKHGHMDGSVEEMASEAALAADDDFFDSERLRSPSTKARSSRWSTSSSRRRSATGPRTSTSSPPSGTFGSGTASTACCTRSCARRRTSRPA